MNILTVNLLFSTFTHYVTFVMLWKHWTRYKRSTKAHEITHLVDGDLARALNLPQAAGVVVQRVAEGSVAWRWGIHAGTLRASVEGEEFRVGSPRLNLKTTQHKSGKPPFRTCKFLFLEWYSRSISISATMAVTTKI